MQDDRMRRSDKFCVVDVTVGQVGAHQNQIARGKAADMVPHIAMAGTAGNQSQLDFRMIVKGAFKTPTLEFKESKGAVSVM